jgi:PAS domain-containing protein
MTISDDFRRSRRWLPPPWDPAAAAVGLEATHQSPGGCEARRPGSPANDAEGWDRRLPASPFPMWIFDPRTGLLVAANNASEKAYGYTRADLLACCVQDLCQPQAPDDGLMTTLLANESLWMGTVRQRRKNGAEFDADVATIGTGDAARPAIMVIVNPIPMRRRSRNSSHARSGHIISNYG